jgi:hypothetical protein
MRKLFLIMAILFFESGLQVFGQETIIVPEGEGSDEMLALENTQILENPVDWSLPGEYEVDYFDFGTQSAFSQRVIVTSEGSLEQGWTEYRHDLVETAANIQGVVPESASSYFIFGGINQGYFPYQTQDDPEFAYVAYYHDGIRDWELFLNDQRYGTIRAACLTEKGMGLLGDGDTLDQNRNLFLAEISFSGNILFYKELSGSGDEYASDLYFDDGNFWFVCETDSSDGDFEGFSVGNRDIGVGRIAIEDGSQPDLLAVGNSGNDVLMDSLYHHQSLYLYLNFQGPGYFENDGLTEDYPALVVINERFEIDNWISVADYALEDLVKLVPISDRIALAFGNFDEAKITFFDFGEDLESLGHHAFMFPVPGFSVQEFGVTLIGEQTLILGRLSDGEEECYSVNVLDDNLGIIISDQTPLSEQVSRTFPVSKVADGTFVFGSKLGSGNLLRLTAFTHLQLTEVPTVFGTMIFHERKLSLNGTPLAWRMVENRIFGNPYGTFFNLYRYQSGERRIFLKMGNEYLPAVNIRDHEQYDLNVPLYFNGTGTLNGEPIVSGKRVLEPGNYVLDMVGNSNERNTIAFSVAVLSELAGSVTEVSPSPQAELEGNPTPDSDSAPLIRLVQNRDPERTYPRWFSFLISGIIVGVLLEIFRPWKMIGRKKHG